MTTLTILTYHRVLDLTPDFMLHKEIVSSSPAMFRKQLEYLKRNYTIITFRELKSLLRSRKPMPQRLLIITFDDGYIDNYQNAFPILRELGVPAAFFVTTGFLEGKCIPWWDTVSHALSTTNKRKAVILGTEYLLTTTQQRAAAEHSVTKQLQLLGIVERRKALNSLLRSLGPAATKPLRGLFMTWGQAKEMEHQGMEILPHTITHANLSAAPLDEIKREVRLSCDTVAGKMKKKIAAFSYPYGFSSNAVAKYLAESGVPFAVTTELGINALGPGTDFHALRRIDISRKDSLWRFKLKLSAPIIAAYRRLKSLK